MIIPWSYLIENEKLVHSILDEPMMFEQFLYAEVPTYVIYTYYDKDVNPLYVGASKKFYDTHFLNHYRNIMENVEYIGIIQYDGEQAMKESKRYWIYFKEPALNKKVNRSLKVTDEVMSELVNKIQGEFIVPVKKMEKFWEYHFGNKNIDVEDWA